MDFSDTFSYTAGTVLDGNNGWSVSGDGVAVSSNGVARILNATLANDFTDDHTKVWTDLVLQPVLGRGADTPDPPSDASFAFYVNLSSNVVVFDGTAEIETPQAVEQGAWTRFTVRSDYTSDTWDLYVDGDLVTNGLGFYNTAADTYTQFGVIAPDGSYTTLLDSVGMTLDVPLPDLSLPFQENFESLSLGALSGQRGWEGTDIDVQNGIGVAGSRGGSLTSKTAVVRHTFRDEQTSVWTDLYVQPTLGSATDTLDPPTDATFAFFVNLSSNVVVYDSTSQIITDTIVPGEELTRFTVHSDYVAKTWDLYVSGKLVTNALSFYNTTIASYGEFGMLGGSESGAVFDDLAIDVDIPFAQPSVRIVTPSASYAESASNITVEVQLSRTYPETVEVSYMLHGGTADPGSDFIFSPGTLSFAVGETNKSFTFTIIEDVLQESDETLTFKILAQSNAVLQMPSNVTFTILSDNSDWNLPFIESFESLSLGALSGQRGWEGTDVFVQDGIGVTGSRGASLTSKTAVVRHTFSDEQTSVWTEMYVQLGFGVTKDTPSPPTNATFAFFVNASSNIVVYDQASLVTTAVTVVEGDLTRFLVYSDYGRKTWDIYVGEQLVSSGLGFFNETISSYGEFGIMSGANHDVIDDIHIGLHRFDFIKPSGAVFRFR
jgi:hypothetical protein